MYRHHLRNVNGKPNRGWLRNMVFGFTQQLVRQDLPYWILYVALRPDRNHRLVSFPYYCKYVGEDDHNTAFCHIDISVPRYIESGRGHNMIQGSVFFDDKTAEDGCTVLVRGFHHHIATWWGRVVARGRPDRAHGGFIHDVEELYTAEDIATFGDFEPVFCLRGQVRITRPEIVHGSTASTGRRIRWTVLPWYVGVQDMEKGTFDVEECDNWDSLCRLHMHHVAPKNSLSGHSNRYGKLVQKFPFSTQLLPCSKVGQALVCCLPWDDSGVMDEASQLLGPDRTAAWQIIQRCRLASLRAFKQAYQQQRAREITCYPKDSYYRRTK